MVHCTRKSKVSKAREASRKFWFVDCRSALVVLLASSSCGAKQLGSELAPTGSPPPF